MALNLTINGEDRLFYGDPMTPLVDVLREAMLLTGAKAVCREGFCGACMVHIDGVPMPSCLKPVGLAVGCNIMSIEGLGIEGDLTPLQQALEDHDVVQCGMCFPGMVMTLTAFLQTHATPTREEIKQALVGNICRCTGYERIIDAVLSMQVAGETNR
ncbi:2Fe-2S iron-sulfur cluster binding domain-containing protein [Sinorhizobium meliloti]|jgi:carbon-monoxide dehydrogenase small subunit|uniref:(2Fe-2S)-binding protein n=1 Tax=Rhizobium meliloti TaxID=382 RepID=UPI00041F9862|nr:(2Fe-2S)-binding protein [Sinorhizobium meliloti]MDW9356466.1 2Fe-2S iron-sulfur cluster binding domain-containing protein [Sinorhizobium meliloti]MDW9592419.1 2Fe-2S iron-sulfur cluster binding domain-containing protein [Sinorhizobium meliloti]MDW9655394.1 2Fe-2S iron-sulfur cluster binding domain-containing protein [Sinorhizobium meliloti]MDW9915176.1 2Fe-2S iron-sulfur cluster binding domain-containing protein [Sinorhizobium meliloti]MDW9939783.1 2Fe-2S iron-sulfur cluster binding domain